MITVTQTYTQIDIRKVNEKFLTDLVMLAYRTQAMEIKRAKEIGKDVFQMTLAECLERIDIQLRDPRGSLVRAHKYTVQRGILRSTERPGDNAWPCLPNGSLECIVTYSDLQKSNKLKESGNLILNWEPSSLSTDYTGMQNVSSRYYSSQNYGLQREAFTIK